MGRLARTTLLAWLAAGCLKSPPDGDGQDAAPPPGGTEWQVALGDSQPYVAMAGQDLVVAAGFRGDVPLEPPVTASGGLSDLLVAGFSAEGKQRFAKGYGGAAGERPTAVAVSPTTGDIGVLGSYSGGAANLGGGALLAPVGEATSLFLARYAADGDHRSSLEGHATDGVYPSFALSMRGSGELAFAGDYHSMMYLGEESAVDVAGSDLFFARVLPDGRVAILVGYGAEGDQRGMGAIDDDLGNLYLIGTTTAGFAIADHSPDADSDGAMFVVQINDSGTDAIWQLGTTGGAVGGLRGATLPDGSLLLSGWFTETFAFEGGDELTSRGGSDVFVAIIEPDGGVRWLTQFGGEGDDEPLGVAAAPDGRFAITGDFRGSASVGDAELVSQGGSDIFVIAFDAEGAVRWARSFGDLADDAGWSVAMDAGGAIVLGAVFSGTVDFGAGEPLEAGREQGAAVVRFR